MYCKGIAKAQRGAAMRERREGIGETINLHKTNEKFTSLKQQMMNAVECAFKNRYRQSDKLTPASSKFGEDLTDRESEQCAHIIAFFHTLALCHSMLADKPEPQTEQGHIDYKAESPDEAALVAAACEAAEAGFPFLGKSKDALEIEVVSQSEKYYRRLSRVETLHRAGIKFWNLTGLPFPCFTSALAH